jgi:DNA-binding HxlR family transcriptional regulator
VRSYGQYCPVAHGAEIFADRWTPLIVRELDLGAHRYNEIRRGLPGISRTLLANRLRQLERDGVVERSDGDYRLTEAGRTLVQVVDALGRWGARHSFGEPRPDELDAALLLWWMHRRIAFERVPEERVTVHFRFRQGRRRALWLVLEREECSVCLTDPGYEVDLHVDADLAAFYEVWLGRRSFAAAVAAGEVRLEGRPQIVRAFPTWLRFSHFADDVRAATAAAAG